MDRSKVPNHGEVGMVKCLKLVIVSVYWCTFFFEAIGYIYKENHDGPAILVEFMCLPGFLGVKNASRREHGSTSLRSYLVVGLEHFYVPYIGNNNPNDSTTHIFQSGWNLQPDIFRKGQNVGVSMINVVAVTQWLSNVPWSVARFTTHMSSCGCPQWLMILNFKISQVPKLIVILPGS